MTLATPKRLAISPAHGRAPKQERKAAERIGGTTTKGSGNGSQKGDARRRGVARIECKNTKHSSFSVTVEMIEKLEAAVLGSKEIPVMEIELELGKHRVYMVPESGMDIIWDMVLTLLKDGK